MINQKLIEKKYADFSPQCSSFKPKGFTNWLSKGGTRYLTLDPYTNAGLRSVLKICDINVNAEFWNDKTLPELYYDTLCLVQEPGRPDNWTTSVEEGMHHLTASIIRTLACKLDTVLGRIFPNTMNKEHFEDNYVGVSTGLPGVEFRNKTYETTFNSNTTLSNVFKQESNIFKRLISMDARLLINEEVMQRL